MLALDDAALARLCIGASRVHRGRRRQWLREIAAKLDPPKEGTGQLSRTPAARRQARARAREKNGVSFYRLEISHHAIEGMIRQWVSTGQITDEQALRLDRVGIERELARGIEAQGESRH